MDKNDSTHKYIEHLNGIINYEVEKPYKEMDADLVEACVELSLELQGKNFTLSNEELEEKVRKIPFVDIAEITAIQQNKRKKIKKKRILLIAAIIAILCAILAVFAIGYHLDYFHSILKDKFGTVFNAPVGETMIEGNDEFINTGSNNLYTDVNSFYKNEKYDVLLPNKLPDGIELTNIVIFENYRNITASFSAEISSYEVYLEKSIPQTILDVANETIDINTHTCYVCRFDDVNSVQVYFEHNGNYYSIGGTNEQILLDVIRNLEEYK